MQNHPTSPVTPRTRSAGAGAPGRHGCFRGAAQCLSPAQKCSQKSMIPGTKRTQAAGVGFPTAQGRAGKALGNSETNEPRTIREARVGRGTERQKATDPNDHGIATQDNTDCLVSCYFPMDRGARQATVHRVTWHWTQLNRLRRKVAILEFFLCTAKHNVNWHQFFLGREYISCLWLQ